MQFVQRPYIAALVILLCTALLYGGFLHSPLLFDDIPFFLQVKSQALLSSLGVHVRGLAYATLALNVKWGSDSLASFRLVSLLLHVSVGVALYFFLFELLRAIPSGQEDRSVGTGSASGLLAALIFVLHPAAVYGAAYLIQRTIVMATLFALLSWISVLRALRTNQDRWWWISLVAYALSVWSKETAVMVPAVSAVLSIWWWQTHGGLQNHAALVRRLAPLLVCYFIVGVTVVFQVKFALGAVYEFNAPQMLDTNDISHPWLLSVMTQSALFFKYLFLWGMPNPTWMSVDMREPFGSWAYLVGAAGFVAWPIVGTRYLLRGASQGLIGIAMLAPWLLFATELTTVRIQEPFVLYRSYLWLAPALSALLIVESKLQPRMFLVLLVGVPLFLFPLAWDRLVTFSHPLLLWTDAERLVEGRSGLTGVERIHHSLGLALYNESKYDLAIKEYSQAIAANPAYSYGYNDRAACLFELKRYQEAFDDFEAALRLKPNYPRSLMGRGAVHEALGRPNEALQDFRAACKLHWQQACMKLPPQERGSPGFNL